MASLILVSGCGGPSAPSSSGSAGQAGGVVTGVVLLSGAADGQHAGTAVFVAGTTLQARTAPDGSYRIAGVAPGRYTILAEKADFVSQPVAKDTEIIPAVHTEAAPLKLATVVLEPRSSAGGSAPPVAAGTYGRVRGMVLLEGLESSEGVRISLGGTRFVTTADADGSWRMLNVEPGPYVVSFSRPGYETTTDTLRVDAGAETVVGDVALLRATGRAIAPGQGPGASVVATSGPLTRADLAGDRAILGLVEIKDPTGNTVIDYTRVAVALENTDYVVAPDERGQFRFASLPAGLYKVVASLDGGDLKAQVADLTMEQSANVNFQFKVGQREPSAAEGDGVVIGRVMGKGKDGGSLPVTGATVAISGTQIISLTAPDGTFRLEKVPSGPTTLVVVKEGFEDFSKDVDAPPAKTTDAGEILLELRVDHPKVVATAPVDGDSGVPVSEDITLIIRFNKDMDRASTLQAIRVQPDADFRLYLGAGQHPQATDDTLVVVMSNGDDKRPIRFSTPYRVLVRRSASDKEGNQMQEDYEFGFRTGGFAVIGSTPADGEENTPSGPMTSVDLRFNTRVKPESLNDSTVMFRPRPDTVPSFSVTEDSKGWSTARVTTRLRPDTRYNVTVGRGVRAYNGQGLSNAPFPVRFRTGRSQTELQGGIPATGRMGAPRPSN